VGEINGEVNREEENGEVNGEEEDREINGRWKENRMINYNEKKLMTKHCLTLIISQGFGGGAPNKFEASAEGAGSEHASDPCRRHGQELVLYINRQCTDLGVGITQNRSSEPPK
jgi:hypothetical protein